MKIDPIRSLSPFEFDKKIRVRVCRIWRPKVIGKDNTFGGLQCILVDEMNDAIQASAKEFDYEYVAPKIKANHVYEITHFSTSRCKTSYKIVPHDVQVCFNTKTNLEELPGVHPNIPSHRFYLLDYSQLSSRIDQDAILTGFRVNDLLIQAIFDDKIQVVQSSSKASYESLTEFEEEDTTTQNFSSTPPLFDKELKRISSTISPTVVTTSPTKSSIRKSLFSSENRKKQKMETEITEEIDEQNISDTEDFPIKSLRNKVSPSKSEIVFIASKTRKNKCKDD